MIKKRQHYIWRVYLEAWAPENRLFMLRDGKVIPTQPADAGVQNLFYKLQRLSREDLLFIRLTVRQATHKEVREVANDLIGLFNAPFVLQDHLDPSQPDYLKAKEMVDEMIANTDEDLHQRLETEATEFMLKLRSDDHLSVFQSRDSVAFHRFLALQNFRTKGVRERVIAATAANYPLSVTAASYPILSHIWAINVGVSNYLERHRHRFVLIRNATGTPFVTSDQPLTNLLANRDGTPPDQLEWYWPLSPSRALIMSPRLDVYTQERVDLSEQEVMAYNQIVYERSHEQIYANSAEILMQFVRQ